MEYCKLKGFPQKVSRLCIGGCPAGEYGWGPVNRGDIEAAILRAVDLGVNFFDTADTYGLGRSEETLGNILASCRQQVILATKFGVRMENGRTYYDNSPRHIETALHASLKHLHSDYIDLYQVHYLDGATPIPEIMKSLIAFKRKGYIRAIGLSNIKDGDAAAFLPYADEISSFQNHYSLAHRDDEQSILAISTLLDTVPLTWGSLGQGILTGKYDKDVLFGTDDRRSRAVYDNFHGDKLIRNLRIVDAMRPMAEKYSVPIASIAIRWILDRLPRSVVITGVKGRPQTEANASAFAFTLSLEERNALDRLSQETPLIRHSPPKTQTTCGN
ncbi:MAG: aldo/keto reductase [Clostridia bacterium]|nr:aldo/keto reductase [Clostridia bacterium]